MIEFFAYLTKAMGENVPVYMAFGIGGLAVLLVLILVLCPLKDQPREDELMQEWALSKWRQDQPDEDGER